MIDQVQNMMNSQYGRNLQLLSSLQQSTVLDRTNYDDGADPNDFAAIKPEPNPFEEELTVKGLARLFSSFLFIE